MAPEQTPSALLGSALSLETGDAPMTMLRVADDLWSSAIMPEGSLERWKVADGSLVKAGQALAEIRIEDALHEVVAPFSGRLFRSATTRDILEPGSLLGYLRAL